MMISFWPMGMLARQGMRVQALLRLWVSRVFSRLERSTELRLRLLTDDLCLGRGLSLVVGGMPCPAAGGSAALRSAVLSRSEAVNEELSDCREVGDVEAQDGDFQLMYVHRLLREAGGR